MGVGGAIFWSKLFYFLFDDSNKSEGSEFRPFLNGGGPFLHGGLRDFLAKKCFFLIIRTNLKDFLSFDHFWMGGPFLQGG